MSKKLKKKDIVLMEIKMNEPISNSELAKNLNMDLGNLGRLVKQLVEEREIIQIIEKKGKTRERMNALNTNVIEPTIIEEKVTIIPEKRKEIKRTEIQKPKTPRIIQTKQLHILTEKNLIIFIKQTRKTKSYELKHRFYDNTSHEIQQLVDKLFQKGLLEKNRNGWIYLKN